MYELRFPFKKYEQQNCLSIEMFVEEINKCYMRDEKLGIDTYYYTLFDAFLAKTVVMLAHIEKFILNLEEPKPIKLYDDSSLSDFIEAAHKENNQLHIFKTYDMTKNKLEIHNSKDMEAFAETLKPTQIAKVFVSSKDDGSMYVQTNALLDPEKIIQIKVMHWFLNKAEIGNDVLTELINCVNSTKYRESTILKDIIESPKFNEKRENTIFEAFKFDKNNKIKDLEEEVTETFRTITASEDRIIRTIAKIRSLQEKIDELTNRIELIKSALDEKDDETKEFLKFMRKHPYILSVSNEAGAGNVKLEFLAPLKYYSKKTIKTIKKNYSNKEKLILDAFLDSKFELMTRASITFDTDTYEHYSDQYVLKDGYLGHPHISRYNCFGNHRSEIIEAARANNLIGIIEQTVQAVLNINFYDGVVINTMLTTLMTNTDKSTWKDNETGELVDTATVINYYKERSNNEETTPEF